MEKSLGYLGILATPKQSNPPFSREAFYRFLSKEGMKTGLPVYVFLPEGVDIQKKTVTGYRYLPQQGSWELKKFPLPSIVYDCLWGRRKYRTQLKWLKAQANVTFLNHFLRNKITTYKSLVQDEVLASFLPPTKQVTSMNVIKEMLQVHGEVVIKPIQSTSGKGVMKITSNQTTHQAEGRDLKNNIFRKRFENKEALLKWIGNLPRVKRLVQPYLDLSSPEGSPFDIRVLVQKDSKGEWVETGRALRSGTTSGLTSNLCGGGRATTVAPFLESMFNEEQRMEIERQISAIGEKLPSYIESKHGRMVELGLDIGVDRKGKVWIIEVNSRPGRNSFKRIENGTKYKTALSSPIKYAHYLLEKKQKADGQVP
ncbi:YheC/YheD family endospore coat-associated protein [Peribacillus glennii]|uniref:YheC/YheD family protein n=1 Tax=Peribacillus glennii TaxID=2303991 RepID=A0A372L657_9BACI|nr:YheC/YheD family protein [Peribacillus glennii]RFU60467.1 YheC/YheD family protein [Peribacillus glennii]